MSIPKDLIRHGTLPSADLRKQDGDLHGGHQILIRALVLMVKRYGERNGDIYRHRIPQAEAMESISNREELEMQYDFQNNDLCLTVRDRK